MRVEHGHGDAAQPFFQFLIVHGIAAAAGLFDLRAQSFGVGDGAVREPLEPRPAQNVRIRSSGRNARIAFPTDVQCTGLLDPMRVIMRTDRAGSILSM